MPWWLAPALSVVGGMLSSRAQRGANDTDLVKLRKEANRSGFHPLTVLRATGGAGFTRGVHGGLSRMGALFSGASRMVGAYNANQRQIVDDAYTAKFRNLQLQGMAQNIQIGKQQLAKMSVPFGEAKLPSNYFDEEEPVTDSAHQAFVKTARLAIDSVGQVTDAKPRALLENRVDQFGNQWSLPPLDDLDGFLLNSLVIGGIAAKKGFGELASGATLQNPFGALTKPNKALHPTLPVLTPGWGFPKGTNQSPLGDRMPRVRLQ